MKAKQWIRDYVDFAMPLIMVIVALNLVEVFIKLPYEYNPITYRPKFDDWFISFNAHLSIFMQQTITGKVFLYSLIFLGVALFARLFTKNLKVNLIYPFSILLIYSAIIGFKLGDSSMLMIVLIDGIIIFLFCLFLFINLRIFFINCHSVIKNISYISILILAILILLIDKLEIVKLSLFIKQNILIAMFCYILIAILYLSIFCRICNKNILIPKDIYYFQI